MIDMLTDPFLQFAFMRRALGAAFALSIGAAPLGVFMMLRRMTLAGDALAHAILPGIALGFLAAGLSLSAMTIGGIIAALAVGLAAVILTRFTQLKEDSAFTLLYLLSLSIGVILLSINAGNLNLTHILFGNILGIDQDALWLISGVSILSLFTLAGFYRYFVIDGLDPAFLGSMGRQRHGLTNGLFFSLLMLNLVTAFQAMGTLMALGLMILPAIGSRFWSHNIDRILPLSIGFALVSSYTGLLLSFYISLPSGPAIVLVAGLIGLFSALFGPLGSLRDYLRG
ncbi:MAG: metal ABC transporter permease [Bdellovibrionales bacterium]